MPEPSRDATVLVAGLGDLGTRAVAALAQRPLGRVVAAGRDPERARAAAARGGLAATLTGGAAHVEHAVLDLDDDEAVTELVGRLAPDVIVAAASRHTWWRTPEALGRLPYGAWISFHVPLVRALTAARAAAAPSARVLALPHPDVVGPVLAGEGLAPDLGAGNVAEIAAKLGRLAAARADVDAGAVRVRLVAHHAAERYAFGAFHGLGGEGAPATPPPVRASVEVAGERLGEGDVRELLNAPYPLGDDLATHEVTTAATVATVDALLAAEPRPLHAPAAGGRPGGYPLRVSRAGIELDLPDGLSEDEACSINAVAARWDGIEHIGEDGTLRFTPAVGELSEELLGLRLERVAVDEHRALAAELQARVAALTR